MWLERINRGSFYMKAIINIGCTASSSKAALRQLHLETAHMAMWHP